MKRFSTVLDPAFGALLNGGRTIPRLPDLVRLRVLTRAARATIGEVDHIEPKAPTSERVPVVPLLLAGRDLARASVSARERAVGGSRTGASPRSERSFASGRWRTWGEPTRRGPPPPRPLTPMFRRYCGP